MFEDNENLQKLIASCAPINVTVKVENKDNCYVIYFDGRNTYEDTGFWFEQWGGFNEYVHLLMDLFGINYIDTTKLEDAYVMANLGSLFDMIKNVGPQEKYNA